MPEKKREGFVLGALMLSLSGILVKIIGLLFRVPLANMVDENAMSHFSSAYEVYNFMLSVATSGLPIGISAMVSRSLALGKYRDVKNLMRSVALIFISAGCLLTVVGLIFARPIARGMNSDETYWCVVNILPAIAVMSVVSVLRGFFQGYNNMNPTALSNVIEALVKLGAGYGIALYRLNNGYPPEEIVAGAILGVTLGTVASCLFLLLRYLLRDRSYRISVQEFMADEGTPQRQLLKEFFVVTLPIMLSSVTVHLFSLIDAAIVMNALSGENDVNLAAAQFAYGSYSSLALPIYNLPSFLVISIGVSLVPSISAAYAKKDRLQLKNTLDQALRLSAVLAFACAFGMMAVSPGAVNLLFGAREGRFLAGDLLRILSFSLIAVGLTNVTNYVLQSIGKSYLSVVSVTVGAAVKTLCNLILLNNPSVGIYGAPVATNIAYPVMLILNLIFIRKHIGYRPAFVTVLLKPAVAGIACFGAAFGVTAWLEPVLGAKITLIPAIFAGAVVYIALIFALRLVSFDEICLILKKKPRKS